MANVTIPALPAAAALTGAEPFETVQGGVSVKTTLDEIYDFITAVVPNLQTGTSYTLALSDNLQTVQLTNASAITLTVPTNATVAFPIGATIPIIQGGAGTVSVAAAGGVTLNSNGGLLSLNGQWAVAALQKLAVNTWILSGNLV